MQECMTLPHRYNLSQGSRAAYVREGPDVVKPRCDRPPGVKFGIAELNTSISDQRTCAVRESTSVPASYASATGAQEVNDAIDLLRRLMGDDQYLEVANSKRHIDSLCFLRPALS